MHIKALALMTALLTGAATANQDTTTVLMETSEGNIVLELNRAAARVTVDNFLAYADDGHYDGTVFHRVISGFMIQGGGHDQTLAEKPTRDPIPNEANNGLSNVRGTIAMARTNDPHSATAQFFINHGDNSRLDHRSETSFGWGYAVFGKVTQGMDVVDRIAALPTAAQGPFGRDVPQPLVVIESVRRINADESNPFSEPRPSTSPDGIFNDNPDIL